MIEKILTAIYLSCLLGIVTVLYRRTFISSDVKPLNRIVGVICTGYVLALSLIYLELRENISFFNFAILLSFCPILWSIVRAGQKLDYEGSLNLIMVSALLSSIGLVTQFRLNLRTRGLLGSLLQTQSISTAISHLLFSGGALCIVVLALYSGLLGKGVDFIERRTGTLFWGSLSFILLALPRFLGKPVGGTLSWLVDRSVQPSELVFKVSFAIFLAKFLANSTLELTGESPNSRRLLKPLGILVLLTGIFFFIPLVLMQREFGTALMIGITLIVDMTVATGRWILLAVGVVTMALAISSAVLVSHRVEERIVGGYLNWREYAFREYVEGSGNWPGYQVFKSLAAVDSAAIWGTGLCKGSPGVPHATTDYIAVPIMEELGIIGLLILLAGFLIFVKVSISSPLEKDFIGFLLVCLPIGILCQAFYNLSGVLAMVAFTGIPIPFISNGGSAVLSNYLLVGILSAALQKRQDRLFAIRDPR